MKRFGIFALALAAASPAFAMSITNLDHVQHTVLLSGGGADRKIVIEPNRTEYVTLAAKGNLSLVTAQNPKKSKSVVNSDGILSGIIGNGRTEGVPADPDYNYTIWPGGKLYIQSRTRSHRPL